MPRSASASTSTVSGVAAERGVDRVRDDQVVTASSAATTSATDAPSDSLPTASHGSLGTLTAPVAVTEIPVGPLVPWLGVVNHAPGAEDQPAGTVALQDMDSPCTPPISVCVFGEALGDVVGEFVGEGVGEGVGPGPMPPPERKTVPRGARRATRLR